MFGPLRRCADPGKKALQLERDSESRSRLRTTFRRTTMATSDLATAMLGSTAAEVAPDGSIVQPLLRVSGATMAHFELPAGATSRALSHRTVEELWFVLSGLGELWRKQDEQEKVVALEPGVCVNVPRGTHFQFRASPNEGVAIIAVTIPGWPGDTEAAFVRGPWVPSTME